MGINFRRVFEYVVVVGITVVLVLAAALILMKAGDF
jgi:hypothetical protein